MNKRTSAIALPGTNGYLREYAQAYDTDTIWTRGCMWEE